MESMDERDEGRRFARVEDSFPVIFTVISKDEYKDIKDEYITRRTQDRMEKSYLFEIQSWDSKTRRQIAHLDPTLVRVIKDIYEKLDMILGLLKQKDIITGEQRSEGICLDISGVGLRLTCNKKVDKGTVLKLTISPPGTPQFTVIALGEVVRITETGNEKNQKDSHELAIEFIAINEDDKEEIIGYTFKRQRELLQSKRRID